MSLADIRERIKAALAGVDGIGVVHDYERWSNDWNRFLDHFKDADNKVNGIAFARTQRLERWSAAGETETAHVFVFRRIMGLKDGEATGIRFDDHLEDLTGAFAGQDRSLDGSCQTIDPDWGPMESAAGMQIEVIELRMFGGVLCHYAECRLCAIDAQPI